MELLAFVPIAIAVVAGITQIAKGLGLPSAWAPLIEVGLGVVCVVGGTLTGAVASSDPDIAQGTLLFWSVLYGVIVGLTSAGLWQYGQQMTDAARKVNGNGKP